LAPSGAAVDASESPIQIVLEEGKTVAQIRMIGGAGPSRQRMSLLRELMELEFRLFAHQRLRRTQQIGRP